MKQNTQRGSVFFYILLAIVLFGALTYAASRGSRTGASALTEEQARLAATAILNQANTVTKAYQKLRLRGFHEEHISFETNLSTADYVNPNCSENTCKMFTPEGGSINWIEPPINANSGEEWFYTGNTPIWQGGGASQRYDLMMYLPNVKESVCKELNVRLGITQNLNDVIPTVTQASLFIHDFSGTISGSGNYLSGPNITGNPSICLRLNTLLGPISTVGPSDSYYFIHSIFLG